MIDEAKYEAADKAHDRLIEEREEAERKALDALARYKFTMFGYWAGIWVHLNRIIGDKASNPFAPLVKTARDITGIVPGKPKKESTDDE